MTCLSHKLVTLYLPHYRLRIFCGPYTPIFSLHVLVIVLGLRSLSSWVGFQINYKELLKQVQLHRGWLGKCQSSQCFVTHVNESINHSTVAYNHETGLPFVRTLILTSASSQDEHEYKQRCDPVRSQKQNYSMLIAFVLETTISRAKAILLLD